MKFRKDEGFTLVELMVVVLIIGILIAVAVPVFNSARANAQKRTCQATQRTAEGAYQTWYADDPTNATTAAGLSTLAHLNGILVPNFIKVALAGCPSGYFYNAAFSSAVVTGGITTTPAGLSVDVICVTAAGGTTQTDHVN